MSDKISFAVRAYKRMEACGTAKFRSSVKVTEEFIDGKHVLIDTANVGVYDFKAGYSFFDTKFPHQSGRKVPVQVLASSSGALYRRVGGNRWYSGGLKDASHAASNRFIEGVEKYSDATQQGVELIHGEEMRRFAATVNTPASGEYAAMQEVATFWVDAEGRLRKAKSLTTVPKDGVTLLMEWTLDYFDLGAPIAIPEVTTKNTSRHPVEALIDQLIREIDTGDYLGGQTP